MLAITEGAAMQRGSENELFSLEIFDFHRKIASLSLPRNFFGWKVFDFQVSGVSTKS